MNTTIFYALMEILSEIDVEETMCTLLESEYDSGNNTLFDYYICMTTPFITIQLQGFLISKEPQNLTQTLHKQV